MNDDDLKFTDDDLDAFSVPKEEEADENQGDSAIFPEEKEDKRPASEEMTEVGSGAEDETVFGGEVFANSFSNETMFRRKEEQTSGAVFHEEEKAAAKNDSGIFVAGTSFNNEAANKEEDEVLDKEELGASPFSVDSQRQVSQSSEEKAEGGDALRAAGAFAGLSALNQKPLNPDQNQFSKEGGASRIHGVSSEKVKDDSAGKENRAPEAFLADRRPERAERSFSDTQTRFNPDDDFEVKEEAVAFGSKPSFMEEEQGKPLSSSFVIEEQVKFSSVIKVILLLLVLSVIGGFLIWKYVLSEKKIVSPIIIKAEDRPMKVLPESPGGMEIPDQDKQVYQLIRSQEEERTVERFFPQTEEPVSPVLEEYSEEGEAAEKTGGQETDDIGNLILQSAAQVSEEEETPQVVVSGEAPLELFPLSHAQDDENIGGALPVADEAVERQGSEEPVVQTVSVQSAVSEGESVPLAVNGETEERVGGETVQGSSANVTASDSSLKAVSLKTEPSGEEVVKAGEVVPAKPASEVSSDDTLVGKAVKKVSPEKAEKNSANKKAVASSGAKKADKTSFWAVQLLSLKDKNAVERAWPKVLKQNTALLIDLPHKVVEVDVPGKGKFYRLLAGKYKDRAEARRLCDKLKKRKQDCVTAPF